MWLKVDSGVVCEARVGSHGLPRGVPGECIWSLIFHRGTHDAAVKQSEGPGSLSLTVRRQLWPQEEGGDSSRRKRAGDVHNPALTHNISITTNLVTQLPTLAPASLTGAALSTTTTPYLVTLFS
ncbi:hypothetical protein Pmani_037165 [Petrolisthes manimaculis]|uniref:Uncharacterized protein n=1 Tax=Petrolisthes manimaculis TaxID=1843537 RepID=A0AAE1TNL4_9EUCA|nr:hypothetical protein Pmani_037165 [Petrolisthes manimaculis]